MSTAVLDLRTYRLAPGACDEFDRIFREAALPMLRGRRIEVSGYGPSLLDDRHYYLARTFASEGERARLGSFYESEEWRDTYADRVDSLLESFHHLVVPA